MKKHTEKDVEKLENELANETDIKRRSFLKATINLYLKAMGMPVKYEW